MDYNRDYNIDLDIDIDIDIASYPAIRLSGYPAIWISGYPLQFRSSPVPVPVGFRFWSSFGSGLTLFLRSVRNFSIEDRV